MPMLAGTLQTDPRSGGIKRSSGVNVLPVVASGKEQSSSSESKMLCGISLRLNQSLNQSPGSLYFHF
jgi:hypothetical protein